MGRILAKIKNTSSLFCIIIKDNYFNKGIRRFSRFFAKKTRALLFATSTTESSENRGLFSAVHMEVCWAPFLRNSCSDFIATRVQISLKIVPVLWPAFSIFYKESGCFLHIWRHLDFLQISVGYSCPNSTIFSTNPPFF